MVMIKVFISLICKIEMKGGRYIHASLIIAMLGTFNILRILIYVKFIIKLCDIKVIQNQLDAIGIC